ncbi:hypothetical protein T310_4975 [Rasamsonia emersonii CBS 393.64]|uniref:Xylanolytic transcriptional activator regulatory domain-containing protein n=1 Tax=Rasamsonia emersonii (strain ATCC 16479 / CBS 393.64 / IMI 116815) TaxID=1408163 RepID=A0A0F4YSB0_RASE3|nr:hypothetical protein T310_4975 [Rasamsonia emersonii CBS 393.64]KKA20995.1 hypothetical protein T310_4975 [Rasamsonia emersonii CBS 393.64]
MFAGTAFVDIKHLRAAGYPNRKAARKAFFQRARLLYDFDYEVDRISLVQALLLMTYWYETPDDQKDTWHWMGVSLSLAHTIGLHRDPANSGMGPRKKRLWKRIWWSTYTRDRLIALGMRRPMRVKDDDCDVPMLTIDDFEFKTYPPEILNMLGNSAAGDDVHRESEAVPVCQPRLDSSVLSPQPSVRRHDGDDDDAGAEEVEFGDVPGPTLRPGAGRLAGQSAGGDSVLDTPIRESDGSGGVATCASGVATDDLPDDVECAASAASVAGESVPGGGCGAAGDITQQDFATSFLEAAIRKAGIQINVPPAETPARPPPPPAPVRPKTLTPPPDSLAQKLPDLTYPDPTPSGLPIPEDGGMMFAATPPHSNGSENGSTQNLNPNVVDSGNFEPAGHGGNDELSLDEFIDLANDAEVTQNDFDALINFDDAGADLFAAEDGLGMGLTNGADGNQNGGSGGGFNFNVDLGQDFSENVFNLDMPGGSNNSNNSNSSSNNNNNKKSSVAGSEATGLDVNVNMNMTMPKPKEHGMTSDLEADLGLALEA